MLDRWESYDYNTSVDCADRQNLSGFDQYGFNKKWGDWTGREMLQAFREAKQYGLSGSVGIYVLRIPSDELCLSDTAILNNASFLVNKGLWEGFLVSAGVISVNKETPGLYGAALPLENVTLRDTTFSNHPARLLESGDERFAALSFRLNYTTVATILVGWLDPALKADDILRRITVTTEKKGNDNKMNG